MGDTDAVRGRGADAGRDRRVRRNGRDRGHAGPRSDPTAERRCGAAGPPLRDLVGRRMGVGQRQHGVGRVGAEHGPGRDHRASTGEAGGGVERRRQVRGRPSEQGDAVAVHVDGVLAAVTRDRVVAHDREAGREGLHAGEAAGVLHQHVGRGHQRRHVVGPSDDHAGPACREAAAELLVASAHSERRVATGRQQRVEGLLHFADTP